MRYVQTHFFLFPFCSYKSKKVMRKNYANFDLEQIIKFVIIFMNNYSYKKRTKGKNDFISFLFINYIYNIINKIINKIIYMKYILTYKIKWENLTKESTYSNVDDVLILIKQIQRWIFSIDSKVIISNFEDFEFFEIIEQNYDQKDSNWEYINITPDWKWDIDINYCDNPYKKDITNDLLNKRLVSTKENWNIYLNAKTISVLWEEFPLKNPSKIRDIFSLLLYSKSKLKSNTIPFTYMETSYDKTIFKEITNKDLRYTPTRDILKKKLEEFKYEFDKDILTINSQWIIVNI